mmetsp:Transcript_104974/g.321603  ORF Transcript_104974/g.321603 Transcript_104974/m.321603 type:complete len:251 (-) Transcript_104974:736-1488(-)
MSSCSSDAVMFAMAGASSRASGTGTLPDESTHPTMCIALRYSATVRTPPPEELHFSKASRKRMTHRSLCILNIFCSSTRFNLPDSSKSTCTIKLWISSTSTEYPSQRTARLTSIVAISPTLSLSIRLNTTSISLTSFLVKPSRIRYTVRRRHNSPRSKSKSSAGKPASSAASQTAVISGQKPIRRSKLGSSFRDKVPFPSSSLCSINLRSFWISASRTFEMHTINSSSCMVLWEPADSLKIAWLSSSSKV